MYLEVNKVSYLRQLKGLDFYLWTDSEAVRGWLFNQREYVDSNECRDLLVEFWLSCLNMKAFPHILRVSSYCNVADWASREAFFRRLKFASFVEPIVAAVGKPSSSHT